MQSRDPIADLTAALTQRGRVWGDQNRYCVWHIHAEHQSLTSHGGPTLDGRRVLGNGGYRRIAEPAP